MGTSYFSDTFPGETGTINDFIKTILTKTPDEQKQIKNTYLIKSTNNEKKK